MLAARGLQPDRLEQSARRLLSDDDDGEECFVVDGVDEEKGSGEESHGRTCRIRIKQISSKLASLGQYVLPSFLRPCAPVPTRPPPSSTAHLSGLRGVASVVVFIYHFAHGSYPGMDHAYGDDGGNHSIFQLPVVRLVYSAEAMVALFFLVSGCSLSHRGVRHVRARNPDRACAVVSSLAFRRPMRLYLPALASSFVAYLAQRAGWMPAKGLPASFVPGLAGDTRLYVGYLGSVTSVWSWEVDFDGLWYNPHLWTIPVEFRCSMMLFLLISTTARCGTKTRLLIDLVLIAYCILGRRWDLALFIMGKLLAELSAMHEERSELKRMKIGGDAPVPRNRRIRLSSLGRRARNMVCVVVQVLSLLLGLYLGSYPASPPRKAPIYSALSALVSHHRTGRRIYHGLAAVLVLYPLFFLPILRRPLNSSVARYLGRISYSLYLVHGTLIRVLGGRILRWAWGVSGTKGWWAFNTGFGLASVLFVPVVVWVADLFEQGVERQCLRFAAWVEAGACEG